MSDPSAWGAGVEAAELLPAADVHLQAESRLDGVLISHLDLAGVHAPNLGLVETALLGVDLGGAQLRSARFNDVLGEHINAANADLDDATLTRTTLRDCSLVGLRAANARISRTLFHGCKLDLANLRMTTLREVAFVDCALRGADFYGATLEHVRFSGCDLAGAEMEQCSLADVDLRSSRIAELRGVASLRGARIDRVQLVELAPHLALELGIDVRDADENL